MIIDIIPTRTFKLQWTKTSYTRYKNPNFRWKDCKWCYRKVRDSVHKKWHGLLKSKLAGKKHWGQRHHKYKDTNERPCLMDFKINKKAGWSRVRRRVVGVIENEFRKFAVIQIQRANFWPFCKDFILKEDWDFTIEFNTLWVIEALKMWKRGK